MMASAAMSIMHMMMAADAVQVLHFRFSRYRLTASLTFARFRRSSGESSMMG
jgi:hypothetical protein